MGSTLVPIVPTLPEQSSLSGCQFEYDDGRKCLDLKIHARNLCQPHYRALARAGAFSNAGAKPDDGEVVSNITALTKAKERIERYAPFAARLVLKAAKAAALKGDSKPAEWLLTHSRAVEPVSPRSSSPRESTGVVINVVGSLAGVKIDKQQGSE